MNRMLKVVEQIEQATGNSNNNIKINKNQKVNQFIQKKRETNLLIR